MRNRPVVLLAAIIIIVLLAWHFSHAQTSDSWRFFSGNWQNVNPAVADAQDTMVCRLLRHGLSQIQGDTTIELAFTKTWTVTPDAIEFTLEDTSQTILNIWVRLVGNAVIECDNTIVSQVFVKTSPVKQRRWEYKITNAGDNVETVEYKNAGNTGLTTKKKYKGKDQNGKPNGLPEKFFVKLDKWDIDKAKFDKEKEKNGKPTKVAGKPK